MCGIAGISGLPASAGEDLLRDMIDEVDYRGPDDRGVWSRDQFAFGMCRLSIIDPDCGNQPMWTDDEVGIVFNGEIYNYQSIRRELESEGYQFRTESDTEVVLKAYHQQGLDAVERLNGMFALAIYDGRTESLHLVRDRLGIKPLYYTKSDGNLLFASEIKSLLRVREGSPPLDEQSIYDFLTLRFIPADQCVWKDVQKVQPGHILTLQLDDGTTRSSRYWSLNFNSSPPNPNRDYLEEFTDRFLKSVKQRLEAADVPVGTLLSGGLDSSAVTAAAVELGHEDFHTFNVSFEGEEHYDESGFARQLAAQVGTRHHEVTVNREEFIDFIPDLVQYTDEPTADLASIPLYFVSKLARDKVKVVLSGEGADEIFGGYDFDSLAKRFHWLKRIDESLPRSIMNVLSWVVPRKKYRDVLKVMMEKGIEEIPAHRAFHMTNHWTEKEKKDLWRGDSSVNPTKNTIRDWYHHTESSSPIDRIQEVYGNHWLVENLLMKADRMTMANSLELRVPFLDHELVEWGTRLPLEWKVGSISSGYTTKKIIREFCKGRIPDEIINRPKRGFPVPAYEWLKGKTGKWVESVLFDNQAKINEFVHLEAVRPVFNRAKKGKYEAAHKIWVLVILEYWLRKWQ